MVQMAAVRLFQPLINNFTNFVVVEFEARGAGQFTNQPGLKRRGQAVEQARFILP